MEYNFAKKADLPHIAELPDPFLKPDGSRVASVEEWPAQREYLKEMLAHYLYGHMPKDSGTTRGEVIFSRPVYNGRAIAETVRITAGRQGEVVFNADLIRPVKKEKVPVFTWNQFTGRHGSPAEEEIVCGRGYAIMEFDKEQLAPDNGNAIHGQVAKAFPECDWGAIAMWAWGHSRLVDHLYTTDWADTEKIIATGHSRGGKVAMCAAIYDERIALCAANGSGCGGAGCFRFLGSRYGEGTGLCETAGSINDMLGYWWTDAFGEFGARQREYTRSNFPVAKNQAEFMADFDFDQIGTTRDEDQLPFDLHFAKALIAPRALITTEGLGDMWANTFGTQVTWRAAQEVFDFLGVPEKNALHFREGKHEFQKTDWLAIADFCDEIFFGKESVNNIAIFRPAEDASAAVSKMVSAMDWKKIKLHYTWSNPLNQK